MLLGQIGLGTGTIGGQPQATVGVKLKFPFHFRSTKPKRYTILTKNSYKTDKHL